MDCLIDTSLEVLKEFKNKNIFRINRELERNDYCI